MESLSGAVSGFAGIDFDWRRDYFHADRQCGKHRCNICCDSVKCDFGDYTAPEGTEIPGKFKSVISPFGDSAKRW